MPIDGQITLKKLEVFLAFMRLNTLARVSEEIGQSTVSVHRALHSLENGLRCPLLRQEGRNLVPLESAYVLAEHARRALAECEEGIRRVRELSGSGTGRLRIGSLYSLTLHCIPQLIVGVKLRKPGLDVDLTLGSNQELRRRLEDGRLDAIIIGLESELRGGPWLPVALFSDEIYLAAPADSPYAGRTAVELTELRQENFVTLTSGFVTSESFERAFAQAGFAPNIGMQVQDIFSLINLVGAGIGYSLLPGRVAAFSPRIRLIPLRGQAVPPQRITLLLPRQRERDPNLLALAAECRRYGQRSSAA